MRTQKSIYDMNDRELKIYKRKLRKQRELRRKCMTLVMTVCLIIICTVSYHSISTSANTGEEEINFKYYTSVTVASGETLWDIADDYIDYNEYHNKKDYIKEVQNINHLDIDCSLFLYRVC